MIERSVFQDKTAVYYTLGCKLNFAETSTIAARLSEKGIRKARRGEKADLCLINTCSVTELADKKGRQAIRKAIKNHPEAFVVVTGCYAQLKPEEIAQIEGVDWVVGMAQKLDIPQLLQQLEKRKHAEIFTCPRKEITAYAPSCSQGDRTRYFLKVQDGCDYFCSYCTIPLARGRSRNGSIDSIVMQAKEAISSGAKEIILTGVNIGDFGKSTGESFFDLLQALDRLEGVRYRISSIEPNLLTDEIIRFTAYSPHFTPHFHIPLQSGSDAVLQLMRRRYDTALFRHKIEAIKSAMPDAFIGVDVIVGARGETEKCFEEAYRFIESLDISQLHVFPYSERPGTKALDIDGTVSSGEKQRRSHLLLELSDQKLHSFYQSQQGQEYEVLFEQPKSGKPMHGFTENYLRIEQPYEKKLVNTTCKIRLDELVEHEGVLAYQGKIVN